MGNAQARKLRRQSSLAERRFWRLIFPLLTNGWHFRKQVQLGSYYVDFACLHAGLVVEIDGDTHGGDLARMNDATRDQYLAGRGFAVLRFSNRDVMGNPEGVYTMLVAALEGRADSVRVSPHAASHSSLAPMAFSPQIASLERSALRDRSKPRKGEGVVPVMGEARR